MWSQRCELASQILWGPSDKCRDFSRLGRSCCSDFGGTVGPGQGIMGESGCLGGTHEGVATLPHARTGAVRRPRGSRDSPLERAYRED